MNDDVHIQIGPGVLGTMVIAWLLATAIMLVHPTSFPLWVMDLANIIMWAGLIVFIVIGLVILVVLLAFLISYLILDR